jgi:hypothetical protein
MKVFGVDPDDAQWDAKKQGDGSWLVLLTFISGGRLHAAEWTFDPRRRHVLPADDNAARMSLPGTEPPQPTAPAPGEATVTHLAPRLSSASGYAPGGAGSGTMGNGPGNGGRPRHERPAAARPTAPEPQGAEWEASRPRETQPRETQPQETRPREAERREPEAPAATAPPVPSTPPASPARVAAQVPRPAAHAASPGEVAQPARMAPPARHARAAQDTPVAPDSQARQPAPPPTAGGNSATVTPAATPPAVPATPSAPPAEPTAAATASATSATSAQPEAGNDQTARQSRKAARGRRSSVPSWDEIMFGNSRQRDLPAQVDLGWPGAGGIRVAAVLPAPCAPPGRPNNLSDIPPG